MSSTLAVPVSPGFASPHYTMVPDELFDIHLADLTLGELKVLLYITRHTLGYRKDADRISLTQICQGIVRRDGKRVDCGTGLTRETACRAVRALEQHGLITVQRLQGPRGCETSIYALRFDGDTPQSDDPTRVVGLNGSARSDHPTTLVGSGPPVLVGSSDPQLTTQETTGQETTDQPAAHAAEDVETRRVWRSALDELRLQMSRANYDTWFKDTRLIDLDIERRAAVIAAPNPFTEEWLRERCTPLVEKTLRGIVGKRIVCAFTVQRPPVERQEQQALL